jgi:uncharacterized protein
LARILLLLAVGVAVYFLLRGVLRVARKDAPPPATTTQGEDMVTCARCGVNLPRSEAMEKDGALVCRDNPSCKPRA